jgi:serine/threonine-protein kinase
MADLTGILIDRYQIQSKLGEGGMAVVYQAIDTRLKRPVALKLIRTEMFPPALLDQILQRFEREATVLARLQHANIVTVHDFGEYERAPYLVMEYLPGGTLRQRMSQPIPYAQAAAILYPIAEALAYAHSKNIVHRDIKPANILFSETNTPKLSDFGIARLLGVETGTQLTTSGMSVGTPAYMAPEQWRGQTTPLVDIYALGVVFYEMLTGRLPYEADTPAELLVKMATQPFVDPRQHVPELSDVVITPLHNILARKPEERLATMEEFATLLSELSDKRTIPAVPVNIEIAGSDLQKTTPVNLDVNEDTTYTPPPQPQPDPPDDQPHGKVNRKFRLSTRQMIAGIGLICLVIIVGLVAILMFRRNGPLASLGVTSIPTSTPQPKSTNTSAPPATVALAPVPPSNTPVTPSSTATQSATPTRKNTPTPTPTMGLGIGSTKVSPKDGMILVYIPAGKFLMGSDNNDDTAAADGKPQHTVSLDAFWIDQIEITNAMFAQFVQATSYKTDAEKDGWAYISSGGSWPKTNGADWRHPNGPESNLNGLENYPVVLVSWNDAQAYCTWAERRLPTEAEWEYAARGGLDGKPYPWGDTFYGAAANFCDANCVMDWKSTNDNDGYTNTSPVGNYAPNGYRLYDMAGNVNEWVKDWYDKSYYSSSPAENPQGPTSGESRVLRGGSWIVSAYGLRVFSRGSDAPSNRNDLNGFRCSLSP